MSPVQLICCSLNGCQALSAFFLGGYIHTAYHEMPLLFGPHPPPLFVFFLGFLRCFLPHISPTCVYTRDFRPTDTGQRRSAGGLFSSRCLWGAFGQLSEISEGAVITRVFSGGKSLEVGGGSRRSGVVREVVRYLSRGIVG